MEQATVMLGVTVRKRKSGVRKAPRDWLECNERDGR